MCRVTGVTPLWLDATVLSTNHRVTFITGNKLTPKQVAYFTQLCKNNAVRAFVCEKTDDVDIYKLFKILPAHVATGRRRLAMGKIKAARAYEELSAGQEDTVRVRHKKTTRGQRSDEPYLHLEATVIRKLREAVPRGLEQLRAEEHERQVAGGKKIWDTPEKHEKTTRALREGAKNRRRPGPRPPAP